MRLWPCVFIGASLGLLGASGCGDDDPPYPYGSPYCTAAEERDDVRICDGPYVLKCRREGGAFVWKDDENCERRGKVCYRGRCE